MGKCALQLLDCLFDTTELVNGNPSGQTNSKDPTRQKTIKRLDPERINYICGKYVATVAKLYEVSSDVCIGLLMVYVYISAL